MPDNREDHIIEEFQSRRKYMLRSFGLCMVLIMLALVVMQIADQYPALFGLGRRGWRLFAYTQLMAGIIYALIGFRQYRCPECDTIIRGHDRYYLGVITNPDRCPNCGRRLS